MFSHNVSPLPKHKAASDERWSQRKDFDVRMCPERHTAKLLQSCPTLCDPTDDSPPGSPIPGILHARALEWAAIFFSNAWKWKLKMKSLSCVQLLVPPWTAAYQAPPSMGFARQEYCSGVPLPSPKFGTVSAIWYSVNLEVCLFLI